MHNKFEEEEIPISVFDPKKYQDSQSQIFKIDDQEQNTNKNLHLFDKETQIIQKGQKRIVIYGNLEQQKKSLYQIVNPYIKQIATTTGSLAYKAGQNVLYKIKEGLYWAYQKVFDTISYTIQQLPKIIFVVNKNKKVKQFKSSQSFILLQMDNDEYQLIKNKKEGKVKVVIPLGQDDPQFTQFLKKNNFVQNYSFPIDIDQQSQKSKTSFMIPSESFQVIYQQCINNAQIQQKKQIQKQQKVIYRFKDCCLFELQGKNSIEYDLLDKIQFHEKTQQGYIAYPQKLVSNSKKNGLQQFYKSNESVEIVQQLKQQNIIEQNKTQSSKQKLVDQNIRVKVQIPSKSRQANEKNKNVQLS